MDKLLELQRGLSFCQLNQFQPSTIHAGVDSTFGQDRRCSNPFFEETYANVRSLFQAALGNNDFIENKFANGCIGK